MIRLEIFFVTLTFSHTMYVLTRYDMLYSFPGFRPFRFPKNASHQSITYRYTGDDGMTWMTIFMADP